MYRTLDQNKQIWKLINQLKFSKEDVSMQVYSFTRNRSYSTKDLTIDECKEYIAWLNNQIEKPKKPTVNYEGQNQRRQVFSIMYELHVIHSDMSSAEKITAIDNYIMNCKSTIHKHLNEMEITELQKTVYQLNRIKENTLKNYSEV